jgi:hypothetical protein
MTRGSSRPFSRRIAALHVGVGEERCYVDEHPLPLSMTRMFARDSRLPVQCFGPKQHRHLVWTPTVLMAEVVENLVLA